MVSRAPPRRSDLPLPSFELPDGQSYADAAGALRLEARTRLRSQMGTSRDSIFFAELAEASEPPAPAPAPTPAERFRTEYNQRYHSHSAKEVVLGNLHPIGGPAALGSTGGRVRSMADGQREASPPVSETVEPGAADPPVAYNQDAYAEDAAAPAVTFVEQPPAAPAEEPPTGDAATARAAREKRNQMHKKQIKKKLRRPDTTSRDMADTAVAAANSGVSPSAVLTAGALPRVLPLTAGTAVLFAARRSACRSTATGVAPAPTPCRAASCTRASRCDRAAAAIARHTTSRRPPSRARPAASRSTSRCTAARCTAATL